MHKTTNLQYNFINMLIFTFRFLNQIRIDIFKLVPDDKKNYKNISVKPTRTFNAKIINKKNNKRFSLKMKKKKIKRISK